jgi:hypothetical protein
MVVVAMAWSWHGADEKKNKVIIFGYDAPVHMNDVCRGI